MDNSNSYGFFRDLVKNNSYFGAEKLGEYNDNTAVDADFILRHSRTDDSLLDIASGSGLIINRIEPYVGHITVVEPFKELTNHIIKSDKINIVNQNVFDFDTELTFNLVTLFGFMHYLNGEEAELVYSKCFKWLNKGGKIIVKNQFGIVDDVIVSGYSEELKRDYYANYRQLDKEIQVLKNIGFKEIDFFDIYSKKRNRWDNTHFYSIVATKAIKKASTCLTTVTAS